MTVRSKWLCTKVEADTDGTFTYEFQAVTSGSVENDSFFKTTPSGQMQLQSVVGSHFVQGQEYYNDMTPATPAGEASSTPSGS